MKDHLRRPKKKTELPLSTTTTTKPKPTPASRRDPLKDLNHGRRTTHPNRSSASSALPNPPKSKSQLLQKQKPLHTKTPQSAPPLPRTTLHSSSSSSTSSSSTNNNKNPPNPKPLLLHSQLSRPCHPSISRARPLPRARSDLPTKNRHRSTKAAHLKARSREPPALRLQSTPEKEQGDSRKQQQQHRAKTPPIHSSISPEIPCAPLPTPACFAAGHLLAGVRDRRKFRPRGILKVGDGDEDYCKELQITVEPSTSDLSNSEPDGSTRTPHLPRASMQWLSSHRENADSSDGWRTPSSNSSISPFSLILKKAAASSGNGAFVQVGTEELPVSSREFSGGTTTTTTNVVSTPSSRSSFLSICKGESVGESERCSFQFGCAAVSVESADLDMFRRSPHPANAAVKRLSGSGSRMLWKEGLVSRTLEMREFVVDDGGGGKDAVDSEGGLGSSTNGHSGGNGFGSIEYVPKPQSDHQKGNKRTPLEVARFMESVSIDSDSFLSSSDSDSRDFFRKHLCES